jgi:Gram-negative porin
MHLFRLKLTIVMFTLSIICTFGLSTNTIAAGIDISGYAQANVAYTKTIDPRPSSSYSTFNIQEMDLILQNDLSNEITAFVDLQFLNTYSSTMGWGDFNLDQFWVRYSPFDALNIKFGHIVPTFNAFNEIKTKFPIQPYIFRPLVYESSFHYIIKPEEYLPSHAALQINGSLKKGKLKFDYAVFGGNSDFIVSNKIAGAGQFSIAGLDSTNFKLYGGRIGARFGGVKLGVSYTYDKTPNTSINNNIDLVNAKLKAKNATLPLSYQIPLLNKAGEGDRNRIGVDLSVEVSGLTFESEYIHAINTLSETDKATLKNLITYSSVPSGVAGVAPIPMFSENLDRQFFYGNLTYDFLERFFITAGFSYLKNHFEHALLQYGLTGILGGAGFRLSDNVTIKAQYTNLRNNISKDPMVKVHMSIAGAGVSVYF